MTETTTDLAKLKASRNARFTWGRVVKIHEIGYLSIVEYVSTCPTETRFHVYQNGVDTNASESTMESAIIYGIACANRDPAAAHFIRKMLGIVS